MNTRRKFFALLPAVPVATAAAVANAGARPLDVKLPIPGGTHGNWGDMLNTAILELQAEVNRLRGAK